MSASNFNQNMTITDKDLNSFSISVQDAVQLSEHLETIAEVQEHLMNQLKESIYEKHGIKLDASSATNISDIFNLINSRFGPEFVAPNIRLLGLRRKAIRAKLEKEIPHAKYYIALLFDVHQMLDLLHHQSFVPIIDSLGMVEFLRESALNKDTDMDFKSNLLKILGYFRLSFLINIPKPVLMELLFYIALDAFPFHLTVGKDLIDALCNNHGLETHYYAYSDVIQYLQTNVRLTYNDFNKWIDDNKAIAQIFYNPDTDLLTGPITVEVIPFLAPLSSLWTGVKQTFNNATETMTNVSSIAKQVKERNLVGEVLEATQTCNKAAKQISDAFDTISLMVNNALQAVSSVCNIKTLHMAEDIIEISYMIYCDFSSPQKNIPLIRWVMYLMKIVRIFDLYKHIENLKEWCIRTVFNNQGVFSDGEVAQAAHAPHEIVVGLVGLILCKMIPRSIHIKEITEILRLYNTSMPAISDGFSFLKESLAFLPECISAWTRYLCPKLFWSDALKEGIISQWSAEVSLIVKEEPTMMQRDLVKVDKLKKLYEQGRIFETQIGLTPDIPITFSSLIQKMMRQLEPIYVLVNDMTGWGKTRRTPFCICLHGMSQVGKSSVAASIAHFLYSDITNEGQLRYVRKIADDFWSKYTGQPVVVYDDAFQSTQLKDALEIIDLISNAPYPLNMPCVNDPSIGNKGAECKAEVVILNTNTPYPEASSVMFDKNALFNRRHLMVQCEVKSEFWTTDAVGNLVPNYQEDFSHLRFHITDNKRERIVTAQFDNLNDFLFCVGEKFEAWMFKESKVLKNIKDCAKRASDLGKIRKAKMYERYAEQKKLADVQSEITSIDDVPLIDLSDDSQFMHVTPSKLKKTIGKISNLFRLNPRGEYEAQVAILGPGGVVDTLTAASQATTCAGATVISIGAALVELRNKKYENSPEALPWKALRLAALTFVGGFALFKMVTNVKYISNNIKGISNADPNQSMLYNILVNNAATIPDHESEARAYNVDKVPRQARKQVFAQATTDPNAERLCNDNYQYRLAEIQIENGSVRAMGALPVGGRLLLVPYHFFIGPDGKQIKDGARMSLIIKDCHPVLDYFDSARLQRLKHKDGTPKDAALYLWSKSMQSLKVILSHFISERDLPNFKKYSDARLMKYNGERELIKVMNVQEKFSYAMPEGSGELMYSRGWRYEALTKPGDCGSPIVLFDTTIERKLLGIHICARKNSHTGYSELITCEEMMPYKELVSRDCLNFPIPEGLENGTPKVVISECCTYLGTVPDTKALSLCSKTRIKPSPIHGLMREPVKQPAILSHLDPRITDGSSPWDKGLAALKPGNPFKLSTLSLVIDDLKIQIRGWQKQPKGVLTEHQAINGDKTVSQYMEPMCLHSSPGQPFTRIRTAHDAGGKFFLFEGEPGHYTVGHPKLRERLNERLEHAREGLRIESIANGCLKDETRPNAKVLECKTRLFTIFPCDHILMTRQYFSEFNCAVMENFSTSFSKIGINPYSADWDDLCQRMMAFSNFGFCADYKNFDGSIFPQVMDAFMDCVEYFYRDEDDHAENMLVRRVLYDEIIHTIMQVGNTVFAKHGCNPSGNGLTTIINTFVNFMYLAYAYLELAPTTHRSMKSFHENALPAIFGDDNWVSIKYKALSFYNLCTVRDCLAQYGITITDSKKSGNIVPYIDNKEADFLKNSLRRSGLFWFALLDKDSIYEMINWIKDSLDDKSCLLDNCNTALRFMYFYGPEEFSSFRTRLDDILFNIYGSDYHLYTFSYLDSVYLDNSEFEVLDQLEKDAAYAQGKDTPTISDVDNKTEVVGVTTQINDIQFSENSGVEKATENQSIPKSINVSGMFAQDDYSFIKFLGKPIRIQTIQWNTTQTELTTIYQFQPYLVAFSKVWNWYRILQSFMFVRMSPVIRVEVNGYRFIQGQLCMFAVPMVEPPLITNWHLKSKSAMTSVRHRMMSACDNSVVELKLPFIHDKTHYQISFNPLSPDSGYTGEQIEPWTVTIAVFNQLKLNTVAAGSPNVNISVFLHFEDIEIKVPAPTRVTDLTTREREPSQKLYVAQSSIEVKLKGWDKIIESVLPSNVIRDSIDSIRGRDFPNNPLIAQPMQRKLGGYFSNSKNIEHHHKFSFDPSIQVEPEQAMFGTTEDEMSIDYLKRIYTWIKTINVTTNFGVNTMLWECPITPVPSTTPRSSSGVSTNVGSGLDLKSIVGTNNSVPIPLLSYISMPFSFWFGGLEFKFEFVCTSFHTAKFAFVIHYGTAYSISSEMYEGFEAMSSYTTFFELSGEKKCVEVSVPYISNISYKKIPNTNWYQIGGGTSDKQFYQVLNSYDSNIGQCALILLNPLMAPNNVANNIDINIYMRGAPDFHLANVHNSNVNFLPAKNGEILPMPSPSFVAQADCNIIGPTSNSIDFPKHLDIVKSLKQVLQRTSAFPWQPQSLSVLTGTNVYVGSCFDFNNTQLLPLNAVVNGRQASGYAVNSSMRYFGSMYRGYLGALKFKFLPLVQDAAQLVTFPVTGSGAPEVNHYRQSYYKLQVSYVPDFADKQSLLFSPSYDLAQSRTGVLPQSDYNNIESALQHNPTAQIGENDDPATASTTSSGIVSVINRVHNVWRGPLDQSLVVAPNQEIEIPWSQPRLFTSTSLDADVEPLNSLSSSITNYQLTRSMMMNAGNLLITTPDARNELNIYYSAGDDFRFGIFMGVPIISDGTSVAATATPVAFNAKDSFPNLWSA
jgi:hypothetical protein